MALNQEQISQIKKQLLEQIEATFPQDKKEIIKQKIASMNSEELEEFLEQNNSMQKSSGQQCIFCSIVSGQINSYKISENADAIAVLDINPISKGHTLIIPKIHEGKISEEIDSLTEKVSEKIKQKLSPKKIETAQSELFGHKILNVLPVYKNENFKSERKPAAPEDLEKLKSKLEEKIKPKKTIIKKEKPHTLDVKNIKLPRRIP